LPFGNGESFLEALAMYLRTGTPSSHVLSVFLAFTDFLLSVFVAV